ncbi:MAG: MFS transporter [Myxococcota bacterium]
MEKHVHNTANSLKAREITADKKKSPSSETQKNITFLKDFFEYGIPLSTVFPAISGVGFYTTFISLYFEDLGYNKISIGIIQAAYFLGLLLGAWKCEQLVRRVGHIQILAASGSFLAATTLIQALTTPLARERSITQPRTGPLKAL